MRFNRRRIIKALGAGSVGTLPLPQLASGAAVDGKVNGEKQREIEGLWGGFLKAAPEEEKERDELVNDFATRTCNSISSFLPDVKLSEVKEEREIGEDTLGVLRNVLGHFEEIYKLDLPRKYLEAVSKLSGFIPLLSTGYHLFEICCKIHEKVKRGVPTPDDLTEKFYIAAVIFLGELGFLPLSTGYRSAFAGTRFIANYGLVRIRAFLGLRGYSIALSVVHWALRGTIEGAISYIIEKSLYIASDDRVSELPFDVPDDSELDYEFLEEDRQDGFWDFGDGKSSIISDLPDVSKYVQESDSWF